MNLQNIRRVVTGFNAEGKSVIISDDVVKALYVRDDEPNRGMADIWRGDAVPAVIRDGDDMTANHSVTLLPPANGFVVRVVTIPPDAEAADSDMKEYFEGMGAGTNIRPERSRHPTMHKTPTLDIGFVQSGEIWALMEDGEVLLKEGDFLVQRATLHGWSNRSDRPCTLIGVLVHGEAA